GLLFSSSRRHTRFSRDWSSDVCSSDLTYETIGIAAPVMLVLLRILQGLSTGGEWGGAVLMAVEHAPVGRRGRMGAFPQIGVPIEIGRASCRERVSVAELAAPGRKDSVE